MAKTTHKKSPSRKPSTGKAPVKKSSAATKAVSRAGGAAKRKAIIAGIIASSVMLVLMLGVLLWGVALQNGDKIFPNVHVAGVNIGGMTRSAAIGEVRDTLEGKYDQTLKVTLPDRTLEFESKDVNVTIDVERAVDLAMDYGRSDGAFMAVINYLRYNSQKRVDVRDMDMAMSMDKEYIDDQLRITAAEVYRDCVNTDVKVKGNKVTIVKGEAGRYLDEDALAEKIREAYEICDLSPIEWKYETIDYLEADMQNVYDSVAVKAMDAYYDEENHEIVEAEKGLSFDVEEEAAALNKLGAGETMTIELEEVEPELDAQTLNGQMFGEKLESRSSPYVNNPNRTENLRLACEAINGTILNPDEIFSFNETVGERTAERGFKPATIYGGDGESVDGVGGGICQVASTIYYTTLYMDLEQVMREPHMYRVTYVPLGMDATVYWDSGLDYKFRNTLSNPIKIQANVDGGHVNITFWGIKENDNYVEMTNKVVDDAPMEPVYEVDETKEPGFEEVKQTRYIGARVEAYQRVYDGDGNLIRETTIKSVYKGRPEIIVTGPEEVPEPEFPGMDEDFPMDPDLPAPEEDEMDEEDLPIL